MSDFSDIIKVEKRLRDATNDLHRQAPIVAQAKQVIEYDSDRRKQLLARYVATRLIGADLSYAAAESLARADATYGVELDKLADELKAAYEAQAKWQATQATFDAARSILSLSKETVRNLQG